MYLLDLYSTFLLKMAYNQFEYWNNKTKLLKNT